MIQIKPDSRGALFRGLRTGPRWDFAGYVAAEQLYRVCVKCAADGDKFHDVDPSLAAFVFGDKGLRLAEFLRQRRLADIGSFARCLKKRNEPAVFYGFEGLAHGPPEP